MKFINIYAGFLIFIFCQNTFAQEPDPLSFFPYETGNTWQYRSAFTNEIENTLKIVKDTIINGSIFIQFLDERGEYMREIDSLYNVWEVDNFSANSRISLRYKLNAELGEGWSLHPQTPSSFDSAKIMDIYPSTVFGQDVIIKKIDKWQRFESGDSLWFGTDYLATGFGPVQYDVEPSGLYYLAGAIIDSVQWGQIVGVKDSQQNYMPNEFILLRSYPNPFNPSTTITFHLFESAYTELRIYDILGREVSILLNKEISAGEWNIVWDVKGLSSGVYLAYLRVDEKVKTLKMLLSK